MVTRTKTVSNLEMFANPENERTETHVASSLLASYIGCLQGVNGRGEIIVQYSNYPPKPARLVSTLDRQTLAKSTNKGREVLLVFEQGNPARPVITHLMEDPLEALVNFEVSKKAVGEITDILVDGEKIDGKKIELNAAEQITLKCGECCITLRKDGKIVIKGKNILSYSNGSNRIKGTNVSIN